MFLKPCFAIISSNFPFSSALFSSLNNYTLLLAHSSVGLQKGRLHLFLNENFLIFHHLIDFLLLKTRHQDIIKPFGYLYPLGTASGSP
jgi:hypothetical protein